MAPAQRQRGERRRRGYRVSVNMSDPEWRVIMPAGRMGVSSAKEICRLGSRRGCTSPLRTIGPGNCAGRTLRRPPGARSATLCSSTNRKLATAETRSRGKAGTPRANRARLSLLGRTSAEHDGAVGRPDAGGEDDRPLNRTGWDRPSGEQGSIAPRRARATMPTKRHQACQPWQEKPPYAV